MSSCILVADPDRSLVVLIMRFLSTKGYWVIGAEHATEAIRWLRSVAADLMILDMHMCVNEDKKVSRVFETLAERLHTPVLLLTYTRRLLGPVDTGSGSFNVETRNYLTKPFKISELEDRVEALLKPSAHTSAFRVPCKTRIGPLVLNLRTFEVSAGDKHILLTPTGFALLRYLVEHKGEVVSCERLLQDVWKYPPRCGSPEVVRWHIKNFRGKLNLFAGCPVQIIQTIPRYGYTIPGGIQEREEPSLPQRT